MANKDNFKFCFTDHEGFYPPAIARVDVQKYFPWLTPKRLANLDSLGQGPEFFKNGRAVVYPTKSFLEWLDERSVASIGTKAAKKIDAHDVPNSSGCSRKRKKGRKTKYQEVMERRG
jgi:hypothetical protein